MQKSVLDHLDNEVTFNFPPKKIISIVPSQTELLFDLGLREQVVGITKFCIHPKEITSKTTKIGGTKNLAIEQIIALKPDLIIGNKEENSQSDIELLQQHIPVWMSDIYTLEGAMKTIRDIGIMVDREPEAQYLNFLIKAGFTDLQSLALSKRINKSVAYAIWRKPYMFAGKNTFIDDILTKLGLYNVIADVRYPELDMDELLTLKPEIVFLSSEPYPFKEKHILEIRAKLPNSEVILVNGEMFSWYGSRLVKAVQYFFEFQNSLGGKLYSVTN